ncbi:FAD-binding oxidoreductase [Magnetospirillum sp. 15-1]|uniref:FAD-binding oxidoreductase n=1 Tax=Magnetospirillum sp. 15-1 TaxID=1979370 RepID=UPI000BBBF789|nr:FAD-binding oxidoreductase [Magnetospirillum sp. 15-1]
MSLSAALPKGVTKAKFLRAVAEYRAIVGEEHVIVDVERLTPYTKLMIPEDEARHQPSGVIAPKSVEEIQRVLAVCNTYKIPVWTISTGRNFGYGSAAPATAGQMVLDLRRMNRILDVDAEMCTALVEPGVTYQQLYDYITEHNLPLWLSFPASGPIAGPVGNTLDRGMGYNRNGLHMNNFCGLEVVLADGQVVRTGMGGNPKSNSWQCYRWGYGPWTDGIFTQSNLGIVTKMGLWLMPAPPANMTFAAGFKDMDILAKGVDVTRRLMLNNVIENAGLGDSLYGLAMATRRSDLYKGPGAIPDEVLGKIYDSLGITPWTLISTIYGTEEQVATNLRIAKDALEAIGASFVTKAQTGDKHPGINHMHMQQTGKLSLTEFGVYNFRGGGGSAWFSPVIPAKGSELVKSLRLSKAVLTEFGFDYLGGVIICGRHADHVHDLLFDRTDPDEMKRAYACFQKLIKVHADEGYNLYRVNTAFMDQVAETFGPAQRSLNKRLKKALDPNGILAPGKSGITV